MSTLTEAQVIEQLEDQHDTYTTGATGLPVQDDQDARLALDDSAHNEVTNDDFPTGLNGVAVVHPTGRIIAEVYDGGDIVQPVNVTFMEQQAQDAIQGGELFTTGGPYTSDYSLP